MAGASCTACDPVSTQEWRKRGESDQILGGKEMKRERASGHELSDIVALDEDACLVDVVRLSSSRLLAFPY